MSKIENAQDFACKCVEAALERGYSTAFKDIQNAYVAGFDEAEERHAKEIEKLTTELGRCANQFEHLAEMAWKLTTGNVSHHRNYIIGNARNNAEFIRSRFTRKLNER